jgi:hypothetical protein
MNAGRFEIDCLPGGAEWTIGFHADQEAGDEGWVYGYGDTPNDALADLTRFLGYNPADAS